MKKGGRRQLGFSLMEMAVLTAVVAVGVALVVPALSHGRQESRVARCGANLKVIGQAYELWAADNGGFWPPRCRDIGQPGCQIYQPFTHWVGPTPTTERLPYAMEPDGPPALRLCGEPRLRQGGSEGSTDPADYCRPDDYPLNRYVIPNWSLGATFGITRCPSDRRTLIASQPGRRSCNPADAPGGAIVDCYEMWGTSYLTNVETIFPWRGHGPWAAYVETPLKTGRKAGPNYSPQKVFKPARYMVMFDQSVMYDEWSVWVNEFGMGRKNDSARWHEDAVGVPWHSGNALFADLHVSFGQYIVPLRDFTLPCITDYVQAGWSLYPYKYTPLSGCRN